MRIFSLAIFACFLVKVIVADPKCSAPYKRLTDAQVKALRRGILEDMLVKPSKREARSTRHARSRESAKLHTKSLELAGPPHQRWNWGDHIWSSLGGGAAQQLLEITMGMNDNGRPQPVDPNTFHTASAGELASWHTARPSFWRNIPVPDNPIMSRMTFCNSLAEVVAHCIAGGWRAFRCIGTCNLHMGDIAEGNRAAVQNILAGLVPPAILLGAIVAIFTFRFQASGVSKNETTNPPPTVNITTPNITGTAIPVPTGTSPNITVNVPGADVIGRPMNSSIDLPIFSPDNISKPPPQVPPESPPAPPPAPAGLPWLNFSSIASSGLIGNLSGGILPGVLEAQNTSSTGWAKKLLYTNFRVELPRGKIPKGFRQLKDGDNIPISQFGDVPKETRRPLEDGLPPINLSMYSNTLHPRDDTEEDLASFQDADDLISFIYNIWTTLFLPAVEKDDDYDQQYHYVIPNSSDGGDADVSKGGSAIIRIWLSEKPDHAGLTAPPRQWEDFNFSPPNPHRPRGQMCYEGYVPDGADPNDPGPSEHWWNSFSDACKSSFGTTGPTYPKDFSYSGQGRFADPHNGAGWSGKYVADDCPYQIKCSDLVGWGGDGKSGDAFQHTETCRRRTVDGVYHGGIFKHSFDDSGWELRRRGRIQRKKRDGNPVPMECGYFIIHPLGQNINPPN